MLKIFENRRFLLSLCIFSLLVTCIPAIISVVQLINLRTGIEEIERDSSISVQARNVLDIAARSLPGASAITLELSENELATILAETDRHFAKLEETVTELRLTGSGFISKQRETALITAINSVAHSWEEIRDQAGTEMSEAEKTYHFLRMFTEIGKTREILSSIEHDADDAAEKATNASFDRVEQTSVLIVTAILGASLIGLIAIFSNFQFARTMRRSNEQLLGKNQEIENLNVTLEDRIERRTSELKATHRELQANIKELREAQDEIVRKGKLAQLGQLTATVAHEIRNPLNAVRASAFLIERKLKDSHPEIRKPLERISTGIRRCDGIITELLDFARTRQLNLQEIDLDGWLVGLVKDQTEYLPEQLTVECKLGLGGTSVKFDSESMSRAIINFLSNASEAMIGKGSETPEQPTVNPKIILATAITQRGIEISATDNGPGISKDNLNKVLEPLFTTKGFGVGLGLPAVEKIFEQHGGGMEIISTSGKGATFTGWFPLIRQEIAA